ncbi:hypothetical protein V1512DRAFT_39256 [Lipomyces arxii]|uniref:uncharacterized protein n=1 Tax=Lipomyces arxii TaxID=56418 RepID=UPI0034CF0C67
MDAHGIAASETAAVGQKAGGYRHKRVNFIPAAQLEKSVTAYIPKTHGKSASSFYSDLVGLPSSTGSKSSTPSESEGSTSIPTQLAQPHLEPPITRLPVNEDNSGHKYLVRYGWNPLQKEGLGPVGREGRRLPVKVEKRQDNGGIGAKPAKKSKSDTEAATKLTKGKRKIQKKESRIQEQSKARKLYDEIFR